MSASYICIYFCIGLQYLRIKDEDSGRIMGGDGRIERIFVLNSEWRHPKTTHTSVAYIFTFNHVQLHNQIMANSGLLAVPT